MFKIILITIVVLWLVVKIVEKAESRKSCRYRIEVDDKLRELKTSHRINKYFTWSSLSNTGMIAFCEDEKKIYMYSIVTETRTLTIFNYANIVKYEFDSFSVNFWDEKMRKYSIACINDNKLDLLVEMLGRIVKINYTSNEKKYAQIANIPQTAVLLTVKRSSSPSCFGGTRAWGWLKNENFHLLPIFDLSNYIWLPSTYKLLSIKMKDIVNLSQEGEIHYATVVQGGGGGGSSLKGAVLGGLIAGGSGAIIGSRKETEAITSSVTKVDDRATHLKIIENNNLYEIIFEYNDYYSLSKLFESK